MRKLLLFAVIIQFFASCSSDPNDNGGTNVTAVPAAPTNLVATVISTTQVDLQWTDNSTNETGYKVERKLVGGNFSQVASTGSNIATYSDLNLTPNTTYTYKIVAYNSVGNSLQYSNEATVTTNLIPILATLPISDTTAISATSGGNITNDAGSPVTARGVCWSTTSGPTVALSTKTTDGAGTGSFTSSINGLTANSIYYVRAYATNSAGTAYGNEQMFTTTTQTYSYTTGPNFTDIDGNVCPSIITSCGQTWTSKNLNVSRYLNGDIIPQVTNSIQWANLTTGAWSWYNNDSATYASTYGRLYNWYAVNDPRGLAPQGWHVPTDAEWNILTKCIDVNADTNQISTNVAGTAMKSTSGWYNNGNGTNSSGFAGLPGGFRFYDGTFNDVTGFGSCWSASEYGTAGAWARYLYYSSSYVARFSNNKRYGFSVRVVRD
jgi:uncharacterized protein (TIGR02145 family)